MEMERRNNICPPLPVPPLLFLLLLSLRNANKTMAKSFPEKSVLPKCQCFAVCSLFFSLGEDGQIWEWKMVEGVTKNGETQWPKFSFLFLMALGSIVPKSTS
ncbi:hypothetical protein CEXT_284421 [Caerostris extrusa]|uniref:Uncharacterized protein n=1 Tax=Caerostris extrusa TaxID=172846 RepID=A0AAV4U0R6_CAEEX|nr:hypothetical protein CEXT_284421 [Caerostris extrusa]